MPDKNHNKTKVVVAMSGGVDSSVTAALMKKASYDVIGIFLKFWHDPKCKGIKENICCSKEASDDARRVAEKLNIPFYVLDASKEFKRNVVDYYIDEYQSGRTPNPCVVCNKTIKFGFLMEKAKSLGADYLATGHYARIKQGRKNSKSHASFRLYKAKDAKKDQSYFLWQLNQDQLSHTMFPLGDLTKPEVRKLARQFCLPTSNKKESQNICFIPDGNNEVFLSNYIKSQNKSGKILDTHGNMLGTHLGLAYYTIGQRHGLGNIQLRSDSGFLPAYVIKLNLKTNSLIVGEKKDLFGKTLIADKINWINKPKLNTLTAKIRYGHKESSCVISDATPNKVSVEFKKPEMAITSGQSVVFYSKDELTGGGIINNN